MTTATIIYSANYYRIIANTPTMVSVLVPTSLNPTTQYRVEIDTQSSVKNGAHVLKNIRTIKAGFQLTAQ